MYSEVTPYNLIVRQYFIEIIFLSFGHVHFSIFHHVVLAGHSSVNLFKMYKLQLSLFMPIYLFAYSLWCFRLFHSSKKECEEERNQFPDLPMRLIHCVIEPDSIYMK